MITAGASSYSYGPVLIIGFVAFEEGDFKGIKKTD